MKDILILGGSYGGISAAHRLLKQTSKLDAFKITLVSPNTHFYWNMASPRGIVPGKIPDDKLFQPIAPGFSRFPDTQFQFVLGTAESLDVEGQKVVILGNDGVNSKISYDYLILATGSRTKEATPFKGLDSTEETIQTFHDFQFKINEAKTIVLAGAGFTGMETAGELGYTYGNEKEIIMVNPNVRFNPPQNSRLIRIQ